MNSPSFQRPRNFGARSRHRDQNHVSAHAAEDSHDDPSAKGILDSLLVPRKPAEMVATQPELDALLGRLAAAGRFAYDTEFIGELTYVPKLCLIQVATPHEVSLIDPLAKIDLMGFWSLLCDESVEKIVHAGEQDLEPVVRLTGRAPRNIFDTQIAAGFAAMPYPISLSKLVSSTTGARLGKGLTFTHWDARPLSSMQLRYAGDDVRYLLAVHEALRVRIDALGHGAAARGEFDSACDVSMHQFDPDGQYLKIRGAHNLPPIGLKVLRELTAWRDSAAQQQDVPPRSLLRDEILFDMARSPVRSLEKLGGIRGLPRPVESTYGKQIVEITLNALAAPAAELPVPRQNEESPAEKFRADSIYAAIMVLAIGQGIDANLVTARQEVGELSRRLAGGQSYDELRLMKGWRRRIIGEPILKMMEGSSASLLTWREGTLRIVPTAPPAP